MNSKKELEILILVHVTRVAPLIDRTKLICLTRSSIKKTMSKVSLERELERVRATRESRQVEK